MHPFPDQLIDEYWIPSDGKRRIYFHYNNLLLNITDRGARLGTLNDGGFAEILWKGTVKQGRELITCVQEVLDHDQ